MGPLNFPNSKSPGEPRLDLLSLAHAPRHSLRPKLSLTHTRRRRFNLTFMWMFLTGHHYIYYSFCFSGQSYLTSKSSVHFLTISNILGAGSGLGGCNGVSFVPHHSSDSYIEALVPSTS